MANEELIWNVLARVDVDETKAKQRLKDLKVFLDALQKSADRLNKDISGGHIGGKPFTAQRAGREVEKMVIGAKEMARALGYSDKELEQIDKRLSSIVDKVRQVSRTRARALGHDKNWSTDLGGPGRGGQAFDFIFDEGRVKLRDAWRKQREFGGTPPWFKRAQNDAQEREKSALFARKVQEAAQRKREQDARDKTAALLTFAGFPTTSGAAARAARQARDAIGQKAEEVRARGANRPTTKSGGAGGGGGKPPKTSSSPDEPDDPDERRWQKYVDRLASDSIFLQRKLRTPDAIGAEADNKFLNDVIAARIRSSVLSSQLQNKDGILDTEAKNRFRQQAVDAQRDSRLYDLIERNPALVAGQAVNAARKQVIDAQRKSLTEDALAGKEGTLADPQIKQARREAAQERIKQQALEADAKYIKNRSDAAVSQQRRVAEERRLTEQALAADNKFIAATAQAAAARRERASKEREETLKLTDAATITREAQNRAAERREELARRSAFRKASVGDVDAEAQDRVDEKLRRQAVSAAEARKLADPKVRQQYVRDEADEATFKRLLAAELKQEIADREAANGPLKTAIAEEIAAQKRRAVAIARAARAATTTADRDASAANRYEDTLESLAQRRRIAEQALAAEKAGLGLDKNLIAAKAETLKLERQVNEATEAKLGVTKASTAAAAASPALHGRAGWANPHGVPAAAMLGFLNAAGLNTNNVRIPRPGSGGIGPGGTLTQRLQAYVANRGTGEVVDPLRFQRGGQLLASKFITSAGFAIAGGGIYGLVAGIKEMVKDAEEFEKQMAIVESQLEQMGQEAQTGAFRQGIINIAKETGRMASEIAFVTRQLAGVFTTADGAPDLDRARRESEAAFKFAQVTGLEPREINDSLTGIAVSFNLVEDNGRTAFEQIADGAIALENKLGVLSSETVKFAADLAPLAEATGFSVQELQALGAVAQQSSGRPGAQLSEQIGRVLASLQDKSLDVIGTFYKAGDIEAATALSDAFGRGDLSDVIKLLIANFGELDETQQNTLINMIGGRREAAAFVSVLNQGSTALKKMADAEADAAGGLGELENRWSKHEETVSLAFQRLARTFEETATKLFQAGLSDALRSVATVASGVLSVFNALVGVLGVFNDKTGGVAGSIAGVATAAILAGTAVRGLGNLLTAIGVSQTLGSLKAFFGIGGMAKGGQMALFGAGAGASGLVSKVGLKRFGLVAAIAGVAGIGRRLQADRNRQGEAFYDDLVSGTATESELYALERSRERSPWQKFRSTRFADFIFGENKSGSEWARDARLAKFGDANLRAGFTVLNQRGHLTAEEFADVTSRLDAASAVEDAQERVAALRRIEKEFEQQLERLGITREEYESGVDRAPKPKKKKRGHAKYVDRSSPPSSRDALEDQREPVDFPTPAEFLAGVKETFFGRPSDPEAQATLDAISAEKRRAEEIRKKAEAGAEAFEKYQTSSSVTSEALLEAYDAGEIGRQAVLKALDDDIALLRVALAGDPDNAAYKAEIQAKERQIRQINSDFAARQAQATFDARRVRATGDEVALAQIDLEQAVTDAARVRRDRPADTPAHQAADNVVAERRYALIEATMRALDTKAVDEARLAGDPIGLAEYQAQRAAGDLALANASNRNQLLAAQIEADTRLSDLIQDLRNAESAVVEATLLAAGRTTEAAEERLRNLTSLYDQAISRGDELGAEQLRGQIISEQASRNQEFVRERQDELSFLYEMGNITLGAYVGYLQGLLHSPEVQANEDLVREITLQIKRLKDQQSSELSLPIDLRLPTLYESRRLSDARERGVGYQETRVIDNRKIEINATVASSVDAEALLRDIEAIVTRPADRYGYGGRVY